MAPSLGPQDEAAGYWSPRTSTIDWCEHNYEVKISITVEEKYFCDDFPCEHNFEVVSSKRGKNFSISLTK